MTSRLLSQAQAAEYLGIAPKSLRAVPVAPVRIGRRVLYDRAALDRWLDDVSGLGESDHEDVVEEWLAARNGQAKGAV